MRRTCASTRGAGAHRDTQDNRSKSRSRYFILEVLAEVDTIIEQRIGEGPDNTDSAPDADADRVHADRDIRDIRGDQDRGVALREPGRCPANINLPPPRHGEQKPGRHVGESEGTAASAALVRNSSRLAGAKRAAKAGCAAARNQVRRPRARRHAHAADRPDGGQHLHLPDLSPGRRCARVARRSSRGGPGAEMDTQSPACVDHETGWRGLRAHHPSRAGILKVAIDEKQLNCLWGSQAHLARVCVQ